MQWIHTLRWPGKELRLRCRGFDLLTFQSANAGFDLFDAEQDDDRQNNGIADASDYIVDIREYDVPYHVRVAIDKG